MIENTTNKQRAACYVRCSCETDIMEGSYETQEAYFRQMIEEDPNLTLVECYGDFGKSGGEALTRPGFQQMIRDAEEHKFDVLYTKSVSRFSRNVSDFCETVNRFRELGITIFFEREGLNTADRSTELFMNILSAVAQEELRSIRENIRLSLEARAATGHPVGKVPYGYIRIDKDANWGILEEEAKRVRLMFRMAAAGNTYSDILKALNQMEAETGYEWKKSRVFSILTNIAYKGDVLTGKSYVVHGRKKKTRINHGERPQYLLQEHHAPIVTREVFDRVQSLIELGLLHSYKVHFKEGHERLMADESWRAGQDRLEAKTVYAAPEDRYVAAKRRERNE